jgi:hypothetical protein
MIFQNLKKRIILISVLFRLKIIFKIFSISILTIFLTSTLIKGAVKTFKGTEGQDF